MRDLLSLDLPIARMARFVCCAGQNEELCETGRGRTRVVVMVKQDDYLQAGKLAFVGMMRL